MYGISVGLKCSSGPLCPYLLFVWMISQAPKESLNIRMGSQVWWYPKILFSILKMSTNYAFVLDKATQI